MSQKPEKVVLKPLSRYQVVLCTACSYCVLPSALSRHLKEVHRLWAADRQSCIAHLENVELLDPSEVVYPEPNEPPIDGLPVLDGFACEATNCAHLCVTRKRMQAHWREEHARRLDLDELCRPVKLQTFFRGSHTRYFIVNAEMQVDRPSSFLARRGSEETTMVREPPAGIKCEDELDWFLLQHFESNTHKALLPLKSSDSCWLELILQAAADQRFLRYLVLGITASHLVSTSSENKSVYASRASKYGQMARQRFRMDVGQVDSGNIHAVFHFCRMTPFFLLAEMCQPTDRGGSTRPATEDSMIPRWIPLQRQSLSVLWNHIQLIAEWHQVPYQLMQVTKRSWLVDFGSNPYDSQIVDLILFIESMPSPVDLQSCVKALHGLRFLWAVAFSNQSTVSFRDAAYSLGAIVEDDYLRLLQDENPAALIVLAYACVLWNSAEDCYWYMKGHAETFLLRICGKLDDSWHVWLAWPLSMIRPFEPKPP